MYWCIIIDEYPKEKLPVKTRGEFVASMLYNINEMAGQRKHDFRHNVYNQKKERLIVLNKTIT